jgi:hypothetical protein
MEISKTGKRSRSKDSDSAGDESMGSKILKFLFSLGIAATAVTIFLSDNESADGRWVRYFSGSLVLGGAFIYARYLHGVAYRVADWFRRYTKPDWIATRGAVETFKKRIFWEIGPQFIGCGIAAVSAVVIPAELGRAISHKLTNSDISAGVEARTGVVDSDLPQRLGSNVRDSGRHSVSEVVELREQRREQLRPNEEEREVAKPHTQLTEEGVALNEARERLRITEEAARANIARAEAHRRVEIQTAAKLLLESAWRDIALPELAGPLLEGSPTRVNWKISLAIPDGAEWDEAKVYFKNPYGRVDDREMYGIRFSDGGGAVFAYSLDDLIALIGVFDKFEEWAQQAESHNVSDNVFKQIPFDGRITFWFLISRYPTDEGGTAGKPFLEMKPDSGSFKFNLASARRVKLSLNTAVAEIETRLGLATRRAEAGERAGVRKPAKDLFQ